MWFFIFIYLLFYYYFSTDNNTTLIYCIILYYIRLWQQGYLDLCHTKFICYVLSCFVVVLGWFILYFVYQRLNEITCLKGTLSIPLSTGYPELNHTQFICYVLNFLWLYWADLYSMCPRWGLFLLMITPFYPYLRCNVVVLDWFPFCCKGPTAAVTVLFTPDIALLTL